MNKVLVLVEKDYISFSKYNRNISEENLNNTNVINVKNLKFTEEYILDNMELISTFLNLIVIKFNIRRVIIKNLEIAETILMLLKNMNSIKNVCFSEDKELTYTIASLLIENINLEKIECFSLPSIMFYRFKKNQIETRSKMSSISNFFKNNNISTYSELYNKERIVIDEFLSESDIDDMVYFFNANINLKRIEFMRYSNQNLKTILKFLKNNNVKNVTIIIYEKENTTSELLKDVKTFNELNKKYSVNIKIKYSKKYKEKNRIKELNFIMIKNIIITCIIVSIILFVAYKLLEKSDMKKIDKNIENINQIVENNLNEIVVSDSNSNIGNEDIIVETEESNTHIYVSSYYKDYSKVYSELLALNEDTIGWLTVNNTKVNYPIVQTNDNDFYLNHAYDKTANIAGWLFVDYRCDMEKISRNTIIYGHSMLKGNLMFSSLQNILNSSWYNNKNNLNISFSIKENNYNWQIFSVYIVEETNDYLYTDFSNDEEYIKFIEKIKTRSINDFNIEVTDEDKILTLSTCYKDDKHRIVVHAKML